MKYLATLALAFGLACSAAAANDGDLDTTFGADGVGAAGLTNISNTLNGGPVIQPDG